MDDQTKKELQYQIYKMGEGLMRYVVGDTVTTSDDLAYFSRHLKALSNLAIGHLCIACGGTGERVYGSTSTWGGGCGGQAVTSDVCDKCWGTGSSATTGVNLRKLMREVTR